MSGAAVNEGTVNIGLIFLTSFQASDAVENDLLPRWTLAVTMLPLAVSDNHHERGECCSCLTTTPRTTMRSIGGSVASRSCRKIVLPKRFFFSNPCSTDNTVLLKQAVIHRIGDDPYAAREYVLAPADIPLEFVMRDPKLKLASLCTDKNVIFGAQVKTVNIGGMVDVCGRLVDAAVDDASLQGIRPQGRATLHGLCEWVVKGINGENDIPLLTTLRNLDPTMYEAVVAVATGVPQESHFMDTFRYGQHGWVELAKEFVNRGLGEEATLYLSKGGELATIEHLAHTSETCLRNASGATANFLFP